MHDASAVRLVLAGGRRACLALLASLALASPAVADYPDRPIHVIVPFPPGGGTDIIARLVAQKLGDALHVATVVENKPGADSMIGTSFIAHAPPDGYTLGVISQSLTINKTLHPEADFDALRDVKPVAMLLTTPMYLVANPALKVSTLSDLVALAKKNPGTLNYSTSSTAALVAGELLATALGVDVMRIPYKGSAPAVAAVVSGEVSYTIDTLLATKGFIDGGKLKLLAVTSSQRAVQMPRAPTVTEAVGKPFEIYSWFALVAPGGTPSPIVERLNAEVRAILAQPDVAQRMVELGGAPTPMSSKQVADFVGAEAARYEDIVKARKITASQ